MNGNTVTDVVESNPSKSLVRKAFRRAAIAIVAAAALAVIATKVRSSDKTEQ